MAAIEGPTVTAQIMDGKALAAEVREKLKSRVEPHTASGRRRPGLAVILAGDDKASALYVKNKVSSCKKVGIESFMHTFPQDVDKKTLLGLIDELNASEKVDGILVQLPLPRHLSADEILFHVSPEKDVDGLTPLSMGLLFAGKDGLRPCTPLGIMQLLSKYDFDAEGKNTVVIGRSNLVGKPVAMMLMQKNATVTICHSRTKGLEDVCRAADLLVVAIGKPEFVKGSWVKPGACVIDVGIHSSLTEDGQSSITGDVEFSEAAKRAALITPVPGGVGPMTVAMLLANTVQSWEKRHGP